MNTIEEARSRQLAANLAEVTGGGVPAGLADSIVDRLHAVSARRGRRGGWLAAAALLLGLGVVIGVDRVRATGTAAQEPQGQDERVVELTTAKVLAAIEFVDAAGPGDGVLRLLALARTAQAGIVIAADVKGDSKLEVENMAFREAVDAIAAELGAGVDEYQGVLLVGGDAQPVRARRSRVSLTTRSIPVRDFVKQLHAKTGVNFVLADDVAGRVRCKVEQVPWRPLLAQVARELDLEVIGCGGVLALRRKVVTAPPARTMFHMRNKSIGEILAISAKINGQNIVIAPAVQGVVSVFAFGANLDGLMTALTAAVGADVEKLDRGIKRVITTRTTNATTTLTTESTAVLDVVQMTAPLATPVEVTTAVATKVTVFVAGAGVFDLLRAAAVASGHELVRAEQGYRIE